VLLSMVNWQDISRRLREVRGSATQVEFGKALGVAQNIVSRYERGRVRPPLDYLVTVARHGKVTLDWLILGEKGSPKPKKENREPPRSGQHVLRA
jgi:transcriptional regulator with XRE-family HTH domain